MQQKFTKPFPDTVTTSASNSDSTPKLDIQVIPPPSVHRPAPFVAPQNSPNFLSVPTTPEKMRLPARDPNAGPHGRNRRGGQLGMGRTFDNIVIGGGHAATGFVHGQQSSPQNTLVLAGPDPWGTGERQPRVNHPTTFLSFNGPGRTQHDERLFSNDPQAFMRGDDLAQHHRQLLQRNAHVEQRLATSMSFVEHQGERHVMVQSGDRTYYSRNVNVATGLGPDRLPRGRDSQRDPHILTMSEYISALNDRSDDPRAPEIRRSQSVAVYGSNAAIDAVQQGDEHNQHVQWFGSAPEPTFLAHSPHDMARQTPYSQTPLNIRSSSARGVELEIEAPQSKDDKGPPKLTRAKSDFLVYGMGQDANAHGQVGDLIGGLTGGNYDRLQPIEDRNLRHQSVVDSHQANFQPSVLGLSIEDSGARVNIIGSGARQMADHVRRTESRRNPPLSQQFGALSARMGQPTSTLPENVGDPRQATGVRMSTESFAAFVPSHHNQPQDNFLNFSSEDHTTLRTQMAERYKNIGPDVYNAHPESANRHLRQRATVPGERGPMNIQFDARQTFTSDDYTSSLIDNLITARQGTGAGFNRGQLSSIHQHLSLLDQHGSVFTALNDPSNSGAGSQRRLGRQLQRVQKRLLGSHAQLTQGMGIQQPEASPVVSAIPGRQRSFSTGSI